MSKKKQVKSPKEKLAVKEAKHSKEKFSSTQQGKKKELAIVEDLNSLFSLLDRSIIIKIVNILLILLGAVASIVQIWGVGFNLILITLGFLCYTLFLGLSEIRSDKRFQQILLLEIVALILYSAIWFSYFRLEKSSPVTILPFMLLVWAIPGFLLALYKLFALGGISFGRQFRSAWGVASLISVIAIGIGFVWLGIQLNPGSETTIIAVSNFTYLKRDGTIVTSPTNSPISKELEDELNIIVKNDPSVKVIRIPASFLDDANGKDAAINSGLKENASILIWGSIQETFDPDKYKVTTHFELLKHKEIIESASLNKLECERMVDIENNQPSSPLIDIDHFAITLDADKPLISLSATVLGMINYDRGHYRDALSYFSTANSQLDEIADDQLPIDLDYLHFYKGNSFLSLGEYANALKEYDVIYSKPTHLIEGVINRALALQYTGEIDHAYDLLSAILEKYPAGLPDYQFTVVYAYSFQNRGLISKARGNFDDAIKDFTEAIKVMPNYANPYGSRGDIFLSQKKYDAAFNDFNEAVSIAPEAPCSYNDLGWGYFVTKQYPKAEKTLMKGLHIDPTHIKARLNLAAVYAGMNRYDLVEKEYDNLIQYNPNSSYAYLGRGNMYMEEPLLSYDLAIENYSKALELKPDDQDVLFARGVAYARSKRYLAANLDFSRLLELDPESKDALFNRGNVYFQLGSFREAVQDYTKLIELTNNGAKPLILRANAYIQLGQVDLAVIDAKNAKKSCSDPEICQRADSIITQYDH